VKSQATPSSRALRAVLAMSALGCASGGLAVFGLAEFGLSQSRAQSSPTQPEFERVDQGQADRNQLSTSYRDMGVDLRAPLNFDTVYKVEPHSRLLRGIRGWSGGAFVRANAGLIAVFPQSAYRAVGRGVDLAQVPAGTLFVFGDSAGSARSGGAARGDGTTVMRDYRVSGQTIESLNVKRIENASLLKRVEPLAPATSGVLASDGQGQVAPRASGPTPQEGDEAQEPISIWNNEDYRQRMLRALIQSAYDAGQAPSSGAP
jgi:hypothetical protein